MHKLTRVTRFNTKFGHSRGSRFHGQYMRPTRSVSHVFSINKKKGKSNESISMH